MEEFELKLQVKAKKMPDFAVALMDFEIKNEIVGLTEDGDLIIQVEYDNDQQEGIGELLKVSEIFEDDFDEEDNFDDEEED